MNIKTKTLSGTVVQKIDDVQMREEKATYESSPEYKTQQIAELKAQLSATDYKAIKYAEGWITADEYAPIKAERQAIRDRINALEAEM